MKNLEFTFSINDSIICQRTWSYKDSKVFEDEDFNLANIAIYDYLISDEKMKRCTNRSKKLDYTIQYVYDENVVEYELTINQVHNIQLKPMLSELRRALSLSNSKKKRTLV